MFGQEALSSVFASQPSANLPSSLLGNERHCVAESLKLPDRTLCQPRAISLLEIVCPQIAVRLLGREHMIDDYQKAVGNRHDRLLLPQTTRQAVVLGGKIVIFPMREHPDHFCQNGPQGGIAFRRLSIEPFASTLLVPGADPCPRRQVVGRGKTRHIITNFPQNSGGSKLSNRRNTHQQGHGILKRREALFNVLLQLLQGLLQKSNMSQDMFEQQTMMGLNPTIEGLLQLRKLLA